MTTSIRSSIIRSVPVAFAVLAMAIVLIPAIASAALTRQLEVEMTGTDVSELQTFLATDTTIYPQGLVTGYFGFLTKSAVSNYQSRNGIDAVGRVGPITLASINLKMAGGVSQGDVTAPSLSAVTVTPSRTSAVIAWNTGEASRGSVYYDTSWLSEYESPHSVAIGGRVAMTDASLRNSQNVTLTGLQPNTTYYYDVYVTDANGNASMTTQTTFRTTN